MIDFSHPHFAEPHWLWLALLGPLLAIALLSYAARRRNRDLNALVAPQARRDLTRSHSPLRRGVKNAMLVLATLAFGLALARPQWGIQEFAARELGEDIVFVVDCSTSMLATDISPNRLERAKLAVADFVQRHGRGRVGLVAFAGQAFVQCPLTLDYNAFEEALRALDEKTIPVAGTDTGRALEEAFHAMKQQNRRKVLVLLTDGEDLEKSGLEKAEELATEGIVVFTVGVGTEAGAEIRLLNEQGQPELVRDSQGTPVRSRLDEAALRDIARVTHGRYFPLGAAGEGLARLRVAVEAADFGGVRVREFGVDRFHVPVAIVLVLLVVESLIGTRRWRTEAGTARGDGIEPAT